MRFIRIQLIFLSLLVFSFLFLSHNKSYAGFVSIVNGSTTLPLAETDTDNYQLYSFFDLRERVSFVQVTNVGSAATLHVQIFDVSNLCNENNFSDAYTANDTHVYDMRDIQSNDGTGSGFELPDGAYGIVVVTVTQGIGQPADINGSIIGNFRVIDNSGYEYRTNSQSPSSIVSFEDGGVYTFNFNRVSDINFSDVVGITLNNITSNEVTTAGSSITFETTLFNNNEVAFSCSDTTFSCTADTFECGINEAIPHSRDKGLTCPSNNISEGFVRLEIISEESIEAFAGYIGINTGNNSRGSMDSFHQQMGVLSCEERGECRVFVTSTTHNGNLGGVSGADDICQNLADASPLTQGGRYLAWISDSLGNSPDTRFNKVTVPYELVDGTLIANDYSDLIICSNPNCLVAIIDLDENNSTPVENEVWTGTITSGMPIGAVNCNNWVSNANDIDGLVGVRTSISSNWTNEEGDTCNSERLLYCFEQ